MTAVMDTPATTAFARASSIGHAAPSMADSLPSIHFGFDDLRDRMAQFTHRFDEFIAEGRRRVLEERNQFRIRLAELQEDERSKQRNIDVLTQQKSSHHEAMAKEASETAEMHEAIASVTAQRDARAAEREQLVADIASTEQAIEQRRTAQRTHAARLEAQARFNGPELDFWVEHLALRIEGGGQADRLRFIFTHLDDRSWEREAWLDLSTEHPDYQIMGHRPLLPSSPLEQTLNRLNETHDVGCFLKSVRQQFVQALRS